MSITILPKDILVELLIKSIECCHAMHKATGIEIYHTKAVTLLDTIIEVLQDDVDTYKSLL